VREFIVTLQNGRNLELFVGHGRSGHAILLHHGAGSSAYVMERELEFFSSIDVMAISYSRPGYSSSNRHKGRRMADVRSDVAEILDLLEIESFSSIGHSAGGPCALSSGLDSRCRSVVTLSSNAEYGRSDFDFFDGMDPDNVAGYKEMILNTDAYEESVERDFLGFVATAEGIRERAPRIFSSKDVELRQDPIYASILAESLNRANRFGVSGRVDDHLSLITNWGFELSEIQVPVSVIHGGDDLVVPPSHARWLHDHIDHSTLQMVEGYGHFGLFEKMKEEIVEFACQ
jgi:pimeloyl-ACP methyl ester carboxylesterase